MVAVTFCNFFIVVAVTLVGCCNFYKGCYKEPMVAVTFIRVAVTFLPYGTSIL